MGTDEVKFNRVFAVESFPHLRLVFDEYRKLTGKDIESAIKSEMSGDVEDAFLAVGMLNKKYNFYLTQAVTDEFCYLSFYGQKPASILC